MPATCDLSLADRLWLAEQEAADLKRRADAAVTLWEAKRAEVERLRAELAASSNPSRIVAVLTAEQTDKELVRV